MTLEFVDRLSENTRTTGTGDFALIGQLSGYQPFSTIGDGNTVYYEAVSGNDWERGTGTYAATNNILARTTISASSNSGSKVNFNKPPVVSSNIPAALQEEIGGGGGGSDDIQTAVVTITSAQLLALQETPVTLVDAPGVGKSLILTSVAYEYDYGTTLYTGGSIGDAWYGSNAGISATGQNDMSIIGQAASSIWSFTYASTAGATQLLTATENQPIVYQAQSGSDWTGGDGTLTITVKYYVAGEQGSSSLTGFTSTNDTAVGEGTPSGPTDVYNTWFGARAGANSSGSDNSNTAVGTDAAPQAAGLSFSTALGDMAQYNSNAGLVAGAYALIRSGSDSSTALGEGSLIESNCPNSVAVGQRCRIAAAGAIAIGQGLLNPTANTMLIGTASNNVMTVIGAVTVADLPAPSASARAFVTDALSPVFGTAVTGGGAVFTPVYSDGSGWFVG